MTDTEIIKALECCTTKGTKCSNCPAFNKVDRSDCKKYFRGAIDLINSQKVEIERLNNELKEMGGKGMTAQETLKDIIQSGIELGAGDYVDVEALKVAVIALEKQIPIKPDTETINRGIDVSGEYDIDSNYLCPSCKSVVGDYESEDIWYKHCPECGQALEWLSLYLES